MLGHRTWWAACFQLCFRASYCIASRNCLHHSQHLTPITVALLTYTEASCLLIDNTQLQISVYKHTQEWITFLSWGHLAIIYFLSVRHFTDHQVKGDNSCQVITSWHDNYRVDKTQLWYLKSDKEIQSFGENMPCDFCLHGLLLRLRLWLWLTPATQWPDEVDWHTDVHLFSSLPPFLFPLTMILCCCVVHLAEQKGFIQRSWTMT